MKKILSFISCILLLFFAAFIVANYQVHAEEPRYNLTGNIFYDTNQNGVKDQGEANAKNVSVNHRGPASGNVWAGSNGIYELEGVKEGTYKLWIQTPVGYTDTTRNPTSLELNSNKQVDFGIVETTSVNPGEELEIGSEGYYCLDGLWTFAVSDTFSIDNAPSYVSVEWGLATERVYLIGYSDGIAFYATDQHLDTYPTNMYFDIADSWDGIYGILSGPCLAGDPNITPTPTPTITPTPSLDPSAFKAEYYANKNLTGSPVIIRNENAINYDWGEGSPDASVPTNEFSARWTKTSTFEAGIYEFTVTADDGFRLYIDNELVLDKWIDQSATTYKIQKNVIEGQHTVRFEYYEAWVDATAKMNYSKVVIPSPSENPTDYTAKFWNIADDGKVPAIPIKTPDLQRTDLSIDFDWKDQKPASEVNAGFFVAQWVKTANFDAGTYVFNTTSDDGIRVYVDNELILNQWNDHSATSHTVQKTMTAGLHAIKVEYYEKWGDAVAKFNFAKVAAPPPATADYTARFWNIPDNTPVPVIPATAPVVERIDTEINNDWDVAAPAAGINPNFFVAQWTKQATFEAGDYTFTTTSDDGMRVYVDDQIVIDDWNDHGQTKHAVQKTMTAGQHTIRVEYYDKWWTATAKFSYEKTGTGGGPTPPAEQPAIAHMVYDDQLQNGWVNWSWDSVVDFVSEITPFKDAKHIKWNPNNHYSGLYLHTDTGFNTTGYKAITFVVKATKENQKMELILLDDTNATIGTPKKLADYGHDPITGGYTIYVVPLTDLGGTDKVIKGFHLKDVTGETSNEIYVDSVGFTQ